MEWLEVSVTVKNETAEAVAEVLSRYASRGVVIEAGPDGWNTGPVIVRAYLPADDQLRANKRRVQESLWHLGQIQPIPAPAFRPIAEADWAEAWKKQLKVLHIGQRTVIRPSWLDYTSAPGEIVIQLDPGMAFGTGLHPTTQMCLVALEELIRPEAQVLDLGTGSGILAISAAKLGAGCVLAVDNDPVAVKTARGNVKTNKVSETISVTSGSLADAPESYDLVVVNILAKVIVEMTQQGLAERVQPGGTLIAAGIIADQKPEVVAALQRKGLTLVKQHQMEDWVCLVTKRHHLSD
ncbi:MAG: 50S ribosomal protein L11 methyltransferase [Chloroflexi bacterium]|nr:MAG: ribosomal protein L11 methyltransferase [Anaerolineaceae bacterium 4572_32.2]RLC79920.1 MAG: 50S ribosomal protein L11 methyltransferase [Chloroflexota bacterium]RLC85473.1 MAG: 50S ribosomal protein L11 methyltransferase [Chloroflexota bacterium]HEY72520.1 50S ribosomal protein L11 methyltransferase [Thermoflexia bacterium]